MRALPVLSCLVLAATAAAAQRADLLQRMGVADIATMERMIMVPMRDGIRLSTAVIRPRGGAKLPTVLVRTPYLPQEQWPRAEPQGHRSVDVLRPGTESGSRWRDPTSRISSGTSRPAATTSTRPARWCCQPNSPRHREGFLAESGLAAIWPFLQ